MVRYLFLCDALQVYQKLGSVSEDAKRVLQALLQTNHELRPTADMLLLDECCWVSPKYKGPPKKSCVT